MLKLTTITFALIAALTFGATTAQAGQFGRGIEAPQPTKVSGIHCAPTQHWDGSSCQFDLSAGSSQTQTNGNGNCHGNGGNIGLSGHCIKPLPHCCPI